MARLAPRRRLAWTLVGAMLTGLFVRPAAAQDEDLRRQLAEAFERAGEGFAQQIAELVKSKQQGFVENIARLVEQRTAELQSRLAAKEQRIAELEKRVVALEKELAGRQPAVEPAKVTNAFLGVGHVQADAGALVTSVFPESPAARAGIVPGDVITAVAGEKATSETLGGLVTRHEPGAKIQLAVTRDGESREVEAELVDREKFLAAQREKAEQQPAETPSVVLGVTVEEDDSGVFVYEVEDGWTGAVAGLAKNDRITHVNGKAVKTLEEIAAAVQAVKAGQELSLRTLRGEEVIEIVVVGSAGKEGAKLVSRESAKKPEPEKKEPEEPAAPEKKPAFLGVGIAPAEGGLAVTQLVPDTAAAVYGVQVGDLIRKVNGKDVADISALQSALGGLKAGDKATLVVRRGDRDIEISMLLGARGEKVEAPKKEEPKVEEKPAAEKTEQPTEPEKKAEPEKPRQRGSIGIAARETDGGIVITEVLRGGAAEKAGLKVGDVIRQVGGKEVANFVELGAVMRSLYVGDKVSLVVHRGDASIAVELTLGEPL